MKITITKQELLALSEAAGAISNSLNNNLDYKEMAVIEAVRGLEQQGCTVQQDAFGNYTIDMPQDKVIFIYNFIEEAYVAVTPLVTKLTSFINKHRDKLRAFYSFFKHSIHKFTDMLIDKSFGSDFDDLLDTISSTKEGLEQVIDNYESVYEVMEESEDVLSDLLVEAHGLVLEANELSSKGWSLSYEEARDITEKIVSLKVRVESYNDFNEPNDTLECLMRMLVELSGIMIQRVNDMVDDELYGDKSYIDVFGTEEDIKMQQQREEAYRIETSLEWWNMF